MSQHSATPSKTCIGCFRPFVPKRVTRKTCSDACRQRVRRIKAEIDQQFFPLRDDATYRPRNLVEAERALDRGVPLSALLLTADERAALGAAWTGFPFEQRLEAAERLIDLRFRALVFRGRLSSNRDDVRAELADLAFAVIDALEAAHSPTIDSLPTRGRRKRRLASGATVGRWTPAQEPWYMLLGLAYLRHVLSERKEALGADPSENVRHGRTGSLDRPLGRSGDDGERLSLHNVVGGAAIYFSATDDQHSSTERLGGCPYDVAGLVERPSDAYAESLRLKLPSGRLTNPPIPQAMLDEIALEIPGAPRGRTGPTPLRGEEIEQQPWRAAPERERARAEARMRRDAEMRTNMHSEIIDRLDRLQRTADETFARLAETCERLRERFPDDEEVSAAVDRFLEEAGLSR